MADARMGSTVQEAGGYPTWDLLLSNGIVAIIAGTEEEKQSAEVAVFTQLGSIPQLGSTGIDWIGFFTGSKTFGDLDQEARNTLIQAGRADYAPDYSLVNDRLIMSVIKGSV